MKLSAVLKDSLHRVRRSPRLSVAVVLCIALGMAATASVATLVSLTSFQMLPFPDAERLVRIWNSEEGGDARDALAWGDYRELADGMATVDRLEATARSRLIFHLPGRPGRRVEGEAVSDGYLDLLDVGPFMGRRFTEAEKTAGDPVMLLSHRTWGREFNYDEDIIGTTVRTSTQVEGIETTYTVIGVMPPDFHGTIEDDMPDLEFWVPVRSYYEAETLNSHEIRGTLAIGRLRAGTGITAAQQEAAAIAEVLAPEYAAFTDSHSFRVEPMGANWRAGFRQANGLLAGAAGLLLAVAVFNVAMLLVARALERRHELALRGALGASRAQLVVPVLGETLLLALLGGAIGLAVAGPLLSAFLGMSGMQVPEYLTIRPDATTMLVTFTAMLLAGSLAAVMPSLAGTRVDVNDALREGSARLSGSRSSARWGRWLVGGEVAMTLALVVTSALMARSYLEIAGTDPGWDTSNRLRVGLFINPSDVPEEAGLMPFIDRMKAELEAEPGVRSVALAWPTVPIFRPVEGRLQWPGLTDAGDAAGLRVTNLIVGDGFFDALDVPLVAGRAFDTRDADSGMRSAVISRSLAERLGSATGSLDRQVTLNGTDYRVVGVVEDAAFSDPRNADAERLAMYLSLRQLPRRVVSPVIEVAGDPNGYAEPLKQRLGELAPNSALDWVEPVDQFIGWLYRDSAFRLVLVAVFALSALLLSAVGLYAVLAQQVTAATTEIGVRKAMGASDARILGRIIRRGLAVTLAGIGAGLLLSLAFSRVLGGLLHGVGTLDPLAYLVSAGTLLLIALLACLLPARRAARIAPMEALRHE